MHIAKWLTYSQPKICALPAPLRPAIPLDAQEVTCWKTGYYAYYVHVVENDGRCSACIAHIKDLGYAYKVDFLRGQTCIQMMEWCERNLSHVNLLDLQQGRQG